MKRIVKLKIEAISRQELDALVAIVLADGRAVLIGDPYYNCEGEKQCVQLAVEVSMVG